MQFAVRTEELYLKMLEYVSKLTYKIAAKSFEKISGISILLINLVPRDFGQNVYKSDTIRR
ncbi:hypothetical protein J43TS9_12710 [Paenibacillus cineris]|nr:hypothetical protein J43TS9_12710 [Paenibacillus cineris]